MKRENYVNGKFNHRGQGASFMLAAFAITLFTMFFMPVKPAWAKLTDITVTHPVTPADSQPAPGSSNNPVLAFQAASTAGANGGGGTPTLDTLNVTVGGTATLTGCTIYEDTGTTLGQYDGTEPQVATLSGSGPYNFSPAYVLAPQGSTMYFLVTVNVDSGASGGQTITAQIAAGTSGMTITATGVITYDSVNDSVTHNVTVPATDTLTISQGENSPVSGANVEQDQNLVIIHQIKLQSDNADNGQVTMTDIKVDYTGTTNADVANLYFYDDTNGDGSISGDSSLGTAGYSAGEYSLGGLSYTVTTTARYILVVVDVAAGATGSNTISVQMQADGVTVSGGESTACGTCPFSSYNFTITGNTVDVTSFNTSETTTIDKGATAAMFGFTATLSDGTGQMNDVLVYFDAAATANQNDISAVELFVDDGNGTYEGTESSVGPMSWVTDHYEILSAGTTIATSPGTNFIVVVTVHSSNATDNQLIKFKFNATTDVTMTSPDNTTFSGGVFAGNQTFTINPDTVDITTYATAESPTTIDKGASVAMFGFNATIDAGAATLGDVKVYFDAASTADQNDISAVELFVDDGNGTYEGTESSVGPMSWVTDHYEILSAGTTMATSPGTNFIVVVTVHSTNATDNQDIVLKFNAATDVSAVSPDTVTFSGGTFAANQTFTINPDAIDVSSYNTSEATSVSKLLTYAMFGFNLDTGTTGSATLNNVKVYFNSAATADQNDISAVELFVDDGNGTYEGTESSAGPMSWVTDHYEITSPPTSSTVDASGKNYIMVVTIGSGALDGEIFKFEFSNTNDVTAVSPDTVNAIGLPFVGNQQFTVTSGPPDKLKVSNITVGPTTIFRGDRNVPLLSFSVITSSGSGGNNSITINEVYLNFYEMGSGVIDSFVSSNMVKFYDDTDNDGTVNNFKGIFSCNSTTCTLGNLSEAVSNVSSNFYIVTGNTTSTPIYSSFKAGINDGGGFALAESDTLAANNPLGVTSGNITQDFDRKLAQGWNLITASKADTTVNYSSVFSDDTAPYVPYMIEWSNTNVDSTWDCGTCAWSSTVQNNTMSYGKGYFFFAEEDGQVLSTNGGSYATLQHSVSLTKGANIVGNPFNYILPMDATWPATGVYIDNGSTQESLKQAATNGWIEADLFWYNGNTYEAVNTDSAVDPYNYMVPWRGYWIRITETTGSYSIIFKP
jgi:hypothetical protein